MKAPSRSQKSEKLPKIVQKKDQTDSPRRISKLEAEIWRMETLGNQLVRSKTRVLEGVRLLEKALWARTRFYSVRQDPWMHGESLVVVCNQLAVRSIERLDDGYVSLASDLFFAAERALMNSVDDPFAGFHPLRQHLLGATISNRAVLQRSISEPVENVVSTVERALAAEGRVISTLTLFNIAAVYSQAGRFEEAMNYVQQCIALASHYLSMRVNLPNEEVRHQHNCFLKINAAHAVLAHHLVCSIASWCGESVMAVQHGKLALACAERYLGVEHALTTRAAERLHAVQLQHSHNSMTAEGTVDDAPPLVPLQLATFSEPVLPSILLAFTFVVPLPASITTQLNEHPKLPLIHPGFQQPTGKAHAKRSIQTMFSPLQQERTISAAPEFVPQPPKSSAKPLGASDVWHRPPRPPPKSSAASMQKTRPRRKRTGDPDIEREGSPVVPKTQVIVPRPPLPREVRISSQAAQVVTVISKKDFEQYNALQEEARRFIESMTHAPSPSRSQASVPRQLCRVETSDMPPTGVEALHASDQRLKEMSVVLPDHTNEDEILWAKAALHIQKWYRGCCARREFHRRQTAVDKVLRQSSAVDRISFFWVTATAVRDAKRAAEAVRLRRYCEHCATTIKSYAFAWISAEHSGARVLRHLQNVKRNRDDARHRAVQASVIQAAYRGYRGRKLLRKEIHCASRIQKFWRLFFLYTKVRLVVFQRRRVRQHLRIERERASIRLQRWYKRNAARLLAVAERILRQAALAKYLDAMAAQERVYYMHLSSLDEEACVVMIQRCCLRFQRYRKNAVEFRAFAPRFVAAKKIQRWYRHLVALRIVRSKRAQKAEHCRIQRRIHEVREACIDIQKIIRGFLGRCVVRHIRERIDQRHQAARRIQQFALRCAQKRQLQLKLEQKNTAQEQYLRASLRRYSATKIQSIWRMRRDRLFVAQFRHFMVHNRHQLARRIQRAARKYIARQRRRQAQSERTLKLTVKRDAELRDCMARVIQSIWRMHKMKQMKFYIIFKPTEMRREAASRIQRQWRYCAARIRVQRLLLARQARIQAAINIEHFNCYVIQIQSFIRRTLIAPRRLARIAQSRDEEAAIHIQREIRRYLAQKATDQAKAEAAQREREAFNEEEREFAAMRIQKEVRGRTQRFAFHRRKQAATKIGCWYRCIGAQQLYKVRRAERRKAAEETMHCEATQAAQTIQGAWRCHARRKQPKKPSTT